MASVTLPLHDPILAGSVLDKNRTTAATPGAYRSDRLSGREYLRQMTTRKSVRSCGYAMGSAVRIHASVGDGGVTAAHVSGVRVCGSIWLCPVCSARIAAVRSMDLESAIDRHLSQGGTLAFVTLTIRHDRTQRLSDLWSTFLQAWRSYTGHRGYKAASQKMSSLGYHRTIEVTHGANGWHVHAHVLHFLAPGMSDENMASAADQVVEQWRDAAARQGVSVLLRGQDFQHVRGGEGAALARYVYKGVFRESVRTTRSLAFEVSRFDMKRAKGASRAPFQLLEGAMGGSDADLDLWLEWESASKGRRAHFWSRGLRDLLGVGQEPDDVEAAADVPEDSVPLLAVHAHAWRELLGRPEELSALMSSVVGLESAAVAAAVMAQRLDQLGVRYLYLLRAVRS